MQAALAPCCLSPILLKSQVTGSHAAIALHLGISDFETAVSPIYKDLETAHF